MCGLPAGLPDDCQQTSEEASVTEGQEIGCISRGHASRAISSANEPHGPTVRCCEQMCSRHGGKLLSKQCKLTVISPSAPDGDPFACNVHSLEACRQESATVLRFERSLQAGYDISAGCASNVRLRSCVMFEVVYVPGRRAYKALPLSSRQHGCMIGHHAGPSAVPSHENRLAHAHHRACTQAVAQSVWDGSWP